MAQSVAVRADERESGPARHDRRVQEHRPTFVGLLTPMPSELRPVVKAFGLRKIVVDGTEVHAGTVGSVAVVAMKTGMGTERARRATERLLDTMAVDHVMVVGIAGGMGPSAVGDVLFPAVVVDKDSGREYAPNALPGVTPAGKLVTHDDFDMGPDEHARLVADGFIAVDMETAAIAAVCETRGCAWSAVRVISDLVGVTPGGVIDLADADGNPKLGAGLRYMVRHPGDVPKLLRLARDSTAAATAAARAAAETILRP